MLRLTPPAEPDPWPALDPVQQSVVDHRGGALLVTGAPGSGRTTTALALTADRLASADGGAWTSGASAAGPAAAPGAARARDGAEPVLLLAPTRRSAARLRDALSAHLPRTGGAAVVRTPSSLAFSVLRARASLLGEPTPTLISGPEQDLVLADLLAGHQAGEGRPVGWPASVPPAALGLRAFRDELRDLLMRAAERGLRPADLARLGAQHDRPAWQAAAAVYAEYLDVTVLRAGTPDAGARFDPAVVVDEASEALLAWESEVPQQPRPRWGTVVVDDYQEATAGTVRLLHTLAQDGAELVLLADPDIAVQTFRGASPGLVDRAPLPAGSELGAFGASTIVLPRVWRHAPALRSVTAAVTAEIRGTVRTHRAAESALPADGLTAGALPADGLSAGADASVRAVLLRSAAQEAAFVAHTLRAAHLYEGLGWSRMAVIARSGGQVGELRRALSAAHVPVEILGSDLPLRAEPAVRPLLRAMHAALEPDPATLDPLEVSELLVSPLGGTDAVGLRHLRRALRAEEVAGGGTRTSDDLLVEVVADPARASTLPAAVRPSVVRLATVLAAGRETAARPGTGVLDLLWSVWSASGLAEPWRRSALAGGAAGERADRDLDAVLALFTAAEQFADRMPQAPPAAFLAHLTAQDLPADSLAAHGSVAEAVSLMTAAGAAGAEWDLVVVAGVQEGTWPDLRLRDSILGAAHLVDVVEGRAAVTEQFDAESRAAVLDDELRAFAVAVSRARRRLVVTAVRDTEQQPSALVDLVEPPGTGDVDARLAAVPHALDLRAVVAQCRSVVEAGQEPQAGAAAALLAHLAAHGVGGADPSAWYGAAPPSSHAPLWPADGPVPLSPSKLELATQCALRWALEAVGGTSVSSAEQSLGTLVHALAAEFPTGTVEKLSSALDARWSELGLPEGWLSRQTRRRAESMVVLLAQYLSTADPYLALEEPFTARLGRVLLRGVVDRIERVGTDADGRPVLRVVDLKTGTHAVTGAQTVQHPQLGAYQAAVDSGAFDDVAAGARSGGAQLVYVGRGTVRPTIKVQDALSNAPDPAWTETLLADVADVASRSAMDATRGDHCRMCPVRRSCPAWPEGRVVGA
ncbi:ATP-dependent helicase [Actinotalea sp.]|uniref:ATP-dependent helicase n=1 Tax=Actinotalea sp. TaxID=1872145 RepID=UPI003565032E